MICGNPQSRFRVWAGAFLLVVVSLVMCPITGEAFVRLIELKKEPVVPEPDGLRPNRALLASERASSSLVGGVMALLATLDEAGVLPSEGTAQANQLIHGLIQLQSALMKSSSPELSAYRVAAEQYWMTHHKKGERGAVVSEGLTSRVLGMLVLYDKEHPIWDEPKIVSAVHLYNVTLSDWLLLVEVFIKAETVFREQGRSIHTIYDAWRMKMPGGKSK